VERGSSGEGGIVKIALYIAEGVEQLVLTPDSDHEKSLLGKLSAKDRVLSIHHGSFYECRGGWIRHGQDDTSTMIVLRPAPTEEPTEEPTDG
jgi:hypothetical protein